MARNDTTSAIVDNILKILMTGGTLSIGIMLPGMAQVLEEPVLNALKKLDKRAREREMRRIVSYMKAQELIKGNYDHGITITDAGRKRASLSEFKNLSIAKPKKWDRKWRLVMFDIPEKRKQGRDMLTRKLKDLGFRQLQRSVWIHPFPCRQEIEAVTYNYRIDRFTTYLETDHIDKDHLLKNKFSNLLKS